MAPGRQGGRRPPPGRQGGPQPPRGERGAGPPAPAPEDPERRIRGGCRGGCGRRWLRQLLRLLRLLRRCLRRLQGGEPRGALLRPAGGTGASAEAAWHRRREPGEAAARGGPAPRRVREALRPAGARHHAVLRGPLRAGALRGHAPVRRALHGATRAAHAQVGAERGRGGPRSCAVPR